MILRGVGRPVPSARRVPRDHAWRSRSRVWGLLWGCVSPWLRTVQAPPNVRKFTSRGSGSSEHLEPVRRVTAADSHPCGVCITLLLGIYMRYTIKHFVAAGGLFAAILSGAACEPKRIPAMTVS